MLKAVSAAAVFAVAGAAQAAPFALNSVDLGGDAASFGTPITVAGGTYYQDAFGNNYPAGAAFIGVFPDLEYDSYIAMDATGHSTGTYTASGPGGSTPGFGATMGHFADASTLTGGYFTGGGVPSGTSPGGWDGVMIANLTVSRGGTLESTGVRPSIGGEDFAGGNSADIELNGAAVMADSGNLYAVTAYLVGTPTIGTDHYDHYEVWVEQVIPAPGAAALLGLAGLAGIRRRRA